MNATEFPVKSADEIQKLKDGWRHDPCWDIEDTEGFEAHKEELLKYRLEQEAIWKERNEKRIAEEMTKMGITNRDTYYYLKGLEHRIESLGKTIDKIQGH